MNIRRVSHRGVSNVYRSYIDFTVCVSKRPYASQRSELKISKNTGEQHEYVLTYLSWFITLTRPISTPDKMNCPS